MKQVIFFVSILCISNNLYCMDDSDDQLKNGLFCVSKMIDFIEDKNMLELSQEEQEIIRSMYLSEFKDVTDYSQTKDFSAEQIFDLLVDARNSSLPEILRDKIITRYHDTYHREEDTSVQSYCGLIRTFIQSKNTKKIAKNPVYIGQEILIGKKTILTAKHILTNLKEEYERGEDISTKFSPDMLPEDYQPHNWQVVHLFSLPNIDDTSKDATYLIVNYAEAPDHPEIDIACAQIEKEIESDHRIALLTEILPQKASVYYIEYADRYKMYKITNLDIRTNERIVCHQKHQCALTPKFMKPGTSGSGVICDEEKGIVCGILNGVVFSPKTDDYLSFI